MSVKHTWFRMYVSAANNSKTALLPDRFCRDWLMLMCCAKEHDGEIPSVEEAAFWLRRSTKHTAESIKELIKRGLIDTAGNGFTPHDWNGWQFESDVSTNRVKRFRKRFMERSETVSETVQETDTDTETEREREMKRSQATEHTPSQVPKLPIPFPENPVSATREIYDAIYALHPFAGYYDQGAREFFALMSNSVDAGREAATLKTNHGEWAAFFQAEKTAGRKCYVPNIADWFRDKYFLKRPKDGELLPERKKSLLELRMEKL